MALNPYYRRARDYGVLAAGAAGAGTMALMRAHAQMGPYAPTTKDLQYMYNFAKKKFKRPPARFKKGKGNRYRKKPVVKQVKGLKKQVSQLSRIAKADQGTLIYRRRITFRNLASANSSVHGGVTMNSLGMLETVLGQLRYYDPTAPTTLVTADGSTGTYSKEFYFDISSHNFIIKNNYQVPCRVRYYICRIKEDSSITPVTAFTNGLADVGNPSTTSPLVYITDSPQFDEIWSIQKSDSFVLQPGSIRKIFYTNKKFTYNPSVSDNHSSSYQKSFDGSYFLVRTEGCLGHDTANDEQGSLPAGIDIQHNATWKVLYPAGADIKWIHVDDNSNNFTNAGVTSSKPVSDNLQYSLP